MKIQILGSGGGEGFPSAFCSCEHCEKARLLGGKNIRSLSQTIINDELLIDYPADTDYHALRFNVNLGKVKHLLVTHAHEDHFMPISINNRGDVRAHNLKHEKFYIHGTLGLETLYDEVVNAYYNVPSIRKNIVFKAVQDKVPFTIDGYKITPLKAMHFAKFECFNYIIEQGGKSLLYFLDTGYPTEETISYLESLKKPFDSVIMDSTYGYAPPKSSIAHMGFEENKMLKEEFIRRGICNEKTKFVANHFTHNKTETHDTVEKIFEGSDIFPAFDGFVYTI